MEWPVCLVIHATCHTTDSIMKFIADLLLDFIISPYTTDNSRKDREKEKREPIGIPPDLAEERDDLIHELVSTIFCSLRPRRRAFP